MIVGREDCSPTEWLFEPQKQAQQYFFHERVDKLTHFAYVVFMEETNTARTETKSCRRTTRRKIMTKMTYRGHEVKAANDNVIAHPTTDLVYRGAHHNPADKTGKSAGRGTPLFYRGVRAA